ncbi:MAG: hypothetical protein FWE33_00215 [Defluviitaleaceae bacterium]|nr:hypothetical protein [Defluviitaleaceae bacterium]
MLRFVRAMTAGVLSVMLVISMIMPMSADAILAFDHIKEDCRLLSCCGDFLPENMTVSRFYIDGRNATDNDVLNGLLARMGTYVDVADFYFGRTLVREFWDTNGEISAFNVSAFNGCRFGNHSGPFFNFPNVSYVLHTGGGNDSMSGVVCVDVAVISASCLSCGTHIQETVTMPFTCRDC